MTRIFILILSLLYGSANAAIMTLHGDDIKFTFDDASLYGSASVISNTIFFTPTQFKAEALNDSGGAVNTSAFLNITIEITSFGHAINGFQFLENGDYKMNGDDTTVSADGRLSIDSLTSGFSDSVSFSAGPLTIQDALLHSWSANATIDLADTPGWGMDSKVNMELGNTLSAESGNFGETAFIEKKFAGSAVGVTTTIVPVSEPPSLLLFGLALVLMGWMHRIVHRSRSQASNAILLACT